MGKGAGIMVTTIRQCWRWTLLGCLVCSVTASAEAQPFDLFGGRKPRTNPKPEFSARISPETVRRGGELTVSVTVKLPDGFYIYGTDRSFGGATRIEVQSEGLEPLESDFAPDHEGKTALDPDLGQTLTKFYEAVTWSRRFRVRDDAEGSSVKLAGTLQGQYCAVPEAGGICVRINPPYSFELSAALNSGSPRDLLPTASATYARTIRPTRPVRGESAPDPLEYEFRLSPRNAKRGERVTLFVTAWLDAGWHTYSLTQQPLGAAPTEIELDTVRHLKPMGEGFQADRPFVTATSGNLTLEEHHDRVTWSREFESTAEEPGDYGVDGSLTYVVCDARSCLPLRAVEFALGQLEEVAAGPEAANGSDSEASPFAAADVEAQHTKNDENADPKVEPAPRVPAKPAAEPLAAPKPQDLGLLPFLLLCIGGGFFALLTPCSFPMVPITVSFFLKQSELQHKRPWLLALVYCGSIVAAFTVLGVGIAAIFGVSQLNALANIAVLNVLIGCVFVVFALNMLGMFEIHVPSRLLTWSASHEGGGSYVGAMFMGLTFTLTSFTCTFAIAGGLLASTAQGEFYRPIVGMLAFGTAFAAPFFVLALVPGLLSKLPKSGGWMNTVKVMMGMLELGAAVKFFSIADPRQHLFDHVTVMLLWLVLALVTGMYLLGLFRLPHDAPTGSISAFRALLGMAFWGLAGLLAVGVAMPDAGRGMLMNQLLAFAPPRFKSGEGPLGPMIDHHGVEFGLDVDRAIPVAEKQRQPLLLDFTGVNCANCRYMELQMAQSSWKQRIERFVPVQLYVDVPAIPGIADDAYAHDLWKRNNVWFSEFFPAQGMPSYAVTTPDGRHVLARFEGAERADRAGSFTQFLDEGWKEWEKLEATWQPETAAGAILGAMR